MSPSPPDDPNTTAALAAHRDASTGPDDAVPSGPTRLSFAQSPEKLHGKRKPVHRSTPDGRIVPAGRLRRGIGDGGTTVSFPQFDDDDDDCLQSQRFNDPSPNLLLYLPLHRILHRLPIRPPPTSTIRPRPPSTSMIRPPPMSASTICPRPTPMSMIRPRPPPMVRPCPPPMVRRVRRRWYAHVHRRWYARRRRGSLVRLDATGIGRHSSFD